MAQGGQQMETAIGVFASRDSAEESVKELLQLGVPESSLVFLTRSESEARTVGRQLGAFAGGFVGGAAGMSAGVAAATLLLPGIGAVFALGFGAAALLGLAGAGAGATTGAAIAREPGAPQPTIDQKASEDASFFREVLKEGRSLVVGSDGIARNCQDSLRRPRSTCSRHARASSRQDADSHTPGWRRHRPGCQWEDYS